MTSIWNPGTSTGGTTHVGGTIKETQTLSAAQTLVTLATFTYAIGTKSLAVFLNGLLLNVGDDYVETSTSSITLSVGATAGDTITVDGTGDVVVVAIPDAGAIAYTPAGTGAVATTVQSKLRESVSVLDFGADPTGILDSGPAFNLALNSGAVRIRVPGGNYLINTLITLPSTANGQTLEGDDIVGTTLFNGPATVSNMILNNRGVTGSFTIRNIRFTGSSFTGWCISAITKPAVSFIIEDCWASMGSAASGFFTGTMANCFVQGCQFELQQICFNLVGANNGQNNFTNNACTQVYGSFIYAADSNLKNIATVNGLSVSEMFKGDLININNAQGWSISGVNYQDDLTFTSAGSLTSRGIVVTSSNNIQINNCNIVVYPGTAQNHISAGFSISNSQVQISNSSVVGAIWGFELTGTGVNYVDLVGVNLYQCGISFRNSATSTGRFTATACRWEQPAAQNVVWQALGAVDFILNECRLVDAYWNAGANGIGIDSNTSGAFEIRNSTIGRTNANSKQSYFLNNEGTGTLLMTGNTVVGTAISSFNLGAQLIKSGGYYGAGLGGFYMASAVPSSGTWNLGDVVFNSSPSVGQPKAWTCTVAGTPGTWVSQGNL